MSDSFVIQIYGPMEGEFEVQEESGSIYYVTRPRLEDLKDAVRWLTATIAACVDIGADWELRGQGERSPRLANLRAAGHKVLKEFTRGDHEEEVTDLLRRATRIHARTGLHIPWDYVYLGDPAEPVEMSQFLGARAVAGRPIEAGPRARPVNNPGLLHVTRWDAAPSTAETPFGLAQDRRLRSARNGAERRIFDRQAQPVKLLKTLRRNSGGWDALNDFLEQSVVLTHFNTHGKVDHEGPGGRPTAALYVTEEFPIIVDDVKKLPICEQSIIFLNSCHAASVRFSKENSLAASFASRRCSAVIGPTERVGDAYATRWADCFYRALRNRRTVPEAILEARREMLASDGNPMALLYAYIGRDSAALPHVADPPAAASVAA